MKSRISKQFSRAATAFLAGVLILGAGTVANAQSEQSTIGLEGTWRVQVHSIQLLHRSNTTAVLVIAVICPWRYHD